MAVRPRHRFTVEDYHRMAEAGILGEDDRVELIEGEIVEMPPLGSGHAGTVNRLTRLFGRSLGDRAVVAIQNAVRIGDLSEPQPDVALLRPRPDFYGDAHPQPEDVLLLVEVAETSVAFDRRVKASLYARSGIREYWIVDLSAGLVDIHTAPVGDVYQELRSVGPGELVSPTTFPDVELQGADIVGPT
jgi:Uma2 family endonuclease